MSQRKILYAMKEESTSSSNIQRLSKADLLEASFEIFNEQLIFLSYMELMTLVKHLRVLLNSQQASGSVSQQAELFAKIDSAKSKASEQLLKYSNEMALKCEQLTTEVEALRLENERLREEKAELNRRLENTIQIDPTMSDSVSSLSSSESEKNVTRLTL